MLALSWIGYALLAGVAVVMLGSAAANLAGKSPVAAKQIIEKAGLQRWSRIVSIGSIVTAVCLFVPALQPAGVLLASSFWGGAIVTHMVTGSSFLIQSVFLLTVWVGWFATTQIH